MGRKRIKPILLMCAVAVSTIITGILGSVPLPVKAAEGETYTVIFEAYEGTCDMESISVPKGESITLPDGTYEGHCLESWMDIISNGKTTQFIAVGKPGSAYTPERDMRLYANWKENPKAEPGQEEEEVIKKEIPSCTVTFDVDGGKEISTVKVEEGEKITLPEAEKEGYIFLGWYTEKKNGEKTGAELTVAEDITLYARWEKEAEKPVERQEATLTFDADGGEMEGGDITAKVDDILTLPSCTKDGHDFAGWYDNDTYVGNAGDKYTVAGDITLKARYEKKEEIITYLITFDPNGGRKAEHIRAAEGEKITLPGTEKTGYVFLGWYTEKEGGILLGLVGDELEVTKDMTVYALWEKENTEESGDKEPETCKAVFHTEGGTLKNKELTVVKGAGLYLPLPEKQGYGFAGWYLDESGKTFAGAYRDAYRITKDTDFYAKWEKTEEDNPGSDNSKDNDDEQDGSAETQKAYTIKYDANGGTVKESYVKVEKGAGVKLPSAEREGYSFAGWHTGNQEFVGKSGSTYKPDKDMTLFAKWEEITGGEDKGSAEDKKNAGTGNSSDIKAETSQTANNAGKDGGMSTAGSQNEKADASTQKASGTVTDAVAAGTQEEPVIQTGRISPVYLLTVLGMFGVLLAALSIREGKRSSGQS